jgi:transposase
MLRLRVALNRAQRRRVEKLLHRTGSRIEAARCRILLLLNRGKPPKVVADIVGCVRATVYRTVYRYEEAGEHGLLDRRTGREGIKVCQQVLATLFGYLGKSPRQLGWQRASWTLELLALQLERDTAVRLSCSHVRNLLRAMGCRRGRPRPALRIPIRGRRKVLARIERLARRARPATEVFYVDEADIDLNPRIGYTYIRCGEQPLVLTPGKNVKRYVAGALNARTGTVVHTWSERKNSTLFVALLAELGQRYRRSRVLHLVLDNCGIHKSRQTLAYLARQLGRFRLHFLPPYSPEANRIERLWKQLHDHVTRNHQHRTIESLMSAVETFLRCAQPFPGTRVSILRQGE